jgi:hypothetical protein
VPANYFETLAEEAKVNSKKARAPISSSLSQKFKLTITDLTIPSNPHVIFDKLPVDPKGFLIFDTSRTNLLNPTKVFSWIHSISQLQQHTLKMDVKNSKNEVVVIRYIHFDILSAEKYPIVCSPISAFRYHLK